MREGKIAANPAGRVAAMLRIRRFEEQCIQLSLAKKFSGHHHVYVGQVPQSVTGKFIEKEEGR